MSITLMAIEQATAPRLGPYYQRTQSSTAHATTATAFVDELKSSLAPGGTENLFLLRRGFKSDGSSVTVAAADRQRIVASVDATSGAVTPDRVWGVAPADGELLEFHHLDPALELRPAVRAGLRRCFFEDRISLALTSAATERDLTASIFWLTRTDQVRRVEFTSTGSTLLPQDAPWADPFEQGGHVWLAGWPDEFPNTLLISALRPHISWVNGADSVTGPTQDLDVLSCDLDYAAAFAHIEAWKLFPAKLKAAADAGYQATQAMAAAEATRVATAQRRRPPTDWNLTGPFGGQKLSIGAR